MMDDGWWMGDGGCVLYYAIRDLRSYSSGDGDDDDDDDDDGDDDDDDARAHSFARARKLCACMFACALQFCACNPLLMFCLKSCACNFNTCFKQTLNPVQN